MTTVFDHFPAGWKEVPEHPRGMRYEAPDGRAVVVRSDGRWPYSVIAYHADGSVAAENHVHKYEDAIQSAGDMASDWPDTPGGDPMPGTGLFDDLF